MEGRGGGEREGGRVYTIYATCLAGIIGEELSLMVWQSTPELIRTVHRSKDRYG